MTSLTSRCLFLNVLNGHLKLVLTTVTGETISPSVLPVPLKKDTLIRLSLLVYVLLRKARCRLFLSSILWAVRHQRGSDRPFSVDQ